MDLDKKLDNLKRYSSEQNLKILDKRIYNLQLDEDYLKTLSQDFLNYIHIRLHNALSYKKPFKPIEEIKKVHDKVAKLLKKHIKTDKLDE